MVLRSERPGREGSFLLCLLFFLLSFFCLFVLLASASHTGIQTKQQYKQNREDRGTTTSTKRPWSDHALLSPSSPSVSLRSILPFSPTHHLTNPQLLHRLIIYNSVSWTKRHLGLMHGLRKQKMKVDGGMFLVPIGLILVKTFFFASMFMFVISWSKQLLLVRSA